MERYERGPVLGIGTFGTVVRAIDKQTGKVVAIKKISIADSKEGVHVTALREIKLLKEIRHPNIIHLLDVFPLKKNIALVLEFMDSDLEAVIKDRSLVLSPADIKTFMQQLLAGLQACHSCWVVHRDVKPNNCLLAADGTLKLADFGLARSIGSPERDPGRPYTQQVFARWYRAPELFFGATSYTCAVDIWAAGCIMAELLLRRPWFPGMSDLDQLGRVFQALGTPSEANWPGCTKLPGYLEFQPTAAPPLRSQFPTASEECLSLLGQLVSMDPRRRPTAQQALQHSWFSSHPLPTPVSRVPRPASKPAPSAPPLNVPPSGQAGSGPPQASVQGTATAPSGGSQADRKAPVGDADISDRPRKRLANGMAASPVGLPLDSLGKFSPPAGTAVH